MHHVRRGYTARGFDPWESSRSQLPYTGKHVQEAAVHNNRQQKRSSQQGAHLSRVGRE